MIHGAFNGLQPRQDLSRDEIVAMYDRNNPEKAIDKWYLDNVRYGATFYNRQALPTPTNVAERQVGYGFWSAGGEADRAYRLATLFQGNQDVDDYGWLTQVDGSDALPLPYNPGQEARRFMKFIVNQYLKIIRNSKPIVKSYDMKAQSEVKKKIKRALLKYDLMPFFKELEQQLGVSYQPEGFSENTNRQDVEKYFYQNTTTTAEIYGTDLLNQVRAKNKSTLFAFQTFLHTIISGRCMAEITKSKGWPRWEIIHPWNQFFTALEDDDFGNNMYLGGWVREFSATNIATKVGLFGKTWGEQIVSKYGRKELERILQGNPDTLTSVSTGSYYNFYWGRTVDSKISSYTVVRCYWKSLVDSRTLPHKEDPDNKLFYLSEKSKKKGTMVEVYRTATVINDQYVVDEGVCDEIVDPMDMSKIFSPIRVFQPYMMMGYNKSLLEEVEAIQKDMSMLDFKFREMVGFDFGMILAVHGAKFANAQDPYSVMEELKKVRIMVKTSSGDPGNPIDSEKAIEVINLSTAQTAFQYLELWKRKEQMMKDVLNISDISLGTQSGYVGFRTQQESMETASTPLQYNIYGHVQFMTDIMQYSLEQMKVMITSGETDTAETIIGKRGVFTIKEMKKNLFETLLCRVDVDDFVDEKRKVQLMADMRALMQTGMVDMEDLVELESLQTWSEIRSYVKWKMETKKAEAQEQNLLDKIMGLVNTQQTNQAQQAMSAQSAEIGLQKQAMADETKLAGKMLDYDAKTGGQAMAGA